MIRNAVPGVKRHQKYSCGKTQSIGTLFEVFKLYRNNVLRQRLKAKQNDCIHPRIKANGPCQWPGKSSSIFFSDKLVQVSELRLVTDTFSKHKNVQPKKSAIDLVYS